MDQQSNGAVNDAPLTPVIVLNETEFESKALSVTEQAEHIRVIDQASYTNLCLLLRDVIAPMRLDIHGYFDTDIAKANDLHKSLCAKRNAALGPLDRAEAIAKQKIGAYAAEQRRMREEQERLALTEAQRQFDEATEAALEQAEAAGAPREEIQAIIDQPMALPRPFVPDAHQPVSGIVPRKTYKGCVKNLNEFLTAVANGKAAQNLIKINDSALNGLARQYGPELSRFVPGTVAIEETNISTRRK